MGTTEQLARFIAQTQYEDLPATVVAAAKVGILDGVANLLAGSTQPVAKLVSEYTQELGGNPVSSVIGHGFKTNPLNAAFANGVAGHCMDFELQGQPSSHGTSSILPGPIALAEAEGGASGKALILAYTLGWDVQQRIVAACRRAGANLRGFHPPGVYGTLGGTASAAKMLKLNQEQVTMALGIGASRTGGLFANNGTMVKSTHPGNAARMSTEAALLARKGFLSNDAIFEAPRGYVSVLFDNHFDWDGFLADAGTTFHLVDPGFNIKRYPAQIGMQPVINVMSDLRDKYDLKQEDVAKVEIELSRDPGHESRPHPASGLDGKFSFEYCGIIPLINNPVGIDSFSDATRFTPAVDEALTKVSLRHNPALGRGAAATVTMKDGRVLKGECRDFRGSILNPMTRDEHHVKYLDCAKRVLQPKDIDRVHDMVENLESLADVRQLIAILAPSPRV
jgi:2-methylcitrate dehydratase PrpD